MGAFNDATCPKCGKKIGWTGDMIDRPPCPRCGHTVDKNELAKAQKEMDDFEDELFRRVHDDSNQV